MAGDELELYREPARPTTFEVMPQAVELARAVAGTEFVPKGLRGRPEAVVAAVLQGHELGLEPMASITKIHVVDGRPTLAAELMRALVQRAGHEIWLEESSSTRVTMGGRRRGEEHPTRITWTIDDAKRAGLVNKNNWKSYPRAMLIARATGELCRLLFADVLSGLSYTVEEVRDGFDLEADEEKALEEADAQAETLPGRPADVDPPAPPTTSRTATRRSSTDDGSSSSKSSSRSGASGRGRAAAPPAPPPPEPPLPTPDAAPKPVEAGDHSAGDTIPGPASAPSYTPAQALAIRAREVGLSDDERHGLVSAYTAGRTSSGSDLSSAEVKAVFGLLESIEAGELTKPELEADVWLVRLADGTVELSSDEAEVVEEDGSVDEDLDDDSEAEAVGAAQSVSEAETDVPTSSSGTAGVGSTGQESGSNLGTEPPTDAESGSEVSIEVPEGEEGWRAFLRAHGVKLAEALRHAAALAGSPAAAPKKLAELDSNRELGARLVAYITGAES